jgi:transposase
MIPTGVPIFCCTAPIDLRWGFERLTHFAREQTGVEPTSRALFLFFGKWHQALKILYFERDGICLFYKRLHRGTYRLPQPLREGDPRIELDERVLDALLSGIDSSCPKVKRTIH